MVLCETKEKTTWYLDSTYDFISINEASNIDNNSQNLKANRSNYHNRKVKS